MIRFLISLEPVEAMALSKWADSEMRDPRDQIHFVLRMELERRGLLINDKTIEQNWHEPQEDHYATE